MIGPNSKHKFSLGNMGGEDFFLSSAETEITCPEKEVFTTANG